MPFDLESRGHEVSTQSLVLTLIEMSDGVDDLTVPQLKERLLSAGMPPFALIMDMTREDLAQRLRAARADIIDQEARHIYETTIAEEAAAKTGKKGKKGKSCVSLSHDSDLPGHQIEC